MKVAVFGLGYVGLTALCCLAKQGFTSIGVDISAPKVEKIRAGQSPMSEPGIAELLTEGIASGRISAATEIGDRLAECDAAIVCVGTPSGPDGAHDMSHIIKVTQQIAAGLGEDRKSPLTVIYRSTIRPGSMEGLIGPIFAASSGDAAGRLVELVYNPEFMRESSAVADYFHPPKIVVGTNDGRPNATMGKLNEGIVAPFFNVAFKEAELTKFVDNSWHAVKVAYANEIGRVCMQLGISASAVHEIFTADTKLNFSTYYTRPGGAFGGSCLPKDVRALQHMAAESGAHTHLIDALMRSNEAHKYRLFQRSVEGLKKGARILLAGLAFKADTDDLRESPNVDLARALLNEGYKLSIFDPGIDATRLIGANLGYAYTQLPTLTKLLVSKSEAESASYDRVIIANATGKALKLQEGQSVIDLNRLA